VQDLQNIILVVSCTQHVFPAGYTKFATTRIKILQHHDKAKILMFLYKMRTQNKSKDVKC
jgi:hypothetical protein